MTKENLVADFGLPANAATRGLIAAGRAQANARCKDLTDDTNATNPANRVWLGASSTKARSNTYQAEIPKLEVIADHLQIKFQKSQTDGVNLYSHGKGQSAWEIVSRDTNSPDYDCTALSVPGTSEVREYQAYGGLSDQEIGQPSDIMGVTFGR